MNHYGIKGIPYEWFKSYLTNKLQFTPGNNIQSELSRIAFGMPQGLTLGPLLFLKFINSLSKAIIFSLVHHFADDILYVSFSLKDINKRINHDLSNLVQKLRASKILLDVSKTEIVIFKSHSKQIT